MTLTSYLMVGAVTLKFYSAQTVNFSFSLSYFSLFNIGPVGQAEMIEIKAPEKEFGKIKFHKVETQKIGLAKAKKVAPANFAARKDIFVKSATLPFHSPVVLNRIEMANQLPTNLVAFYRPAPEEMKTMLAKTPLEIDEVSTKLAAATIDEGPTFFKYTEDEQVDSEIAPSVVETVDDSATAQAVDKRRGAVDNSSSLSTEEVAVEDLIAFDYSSVHKDIVDKKVPTVSKLTTQVSPQVTTQGQGQKPAGNGELKGHRHNDLVQEEEIPDNKRSGYLAEEEIPNSKRSGYLAEVSIQAVGTDFKENTDLKNFEVRFQNDLSETSEDYGSGSVIIKETLAQPAMTRSVVVLKKGWAPTNTDLILENGVTQVSVPLIDSDTFNNQLSTFEARGPMGSLLVELDDETEMATLDVPFGKVLLLDGDMKYTTKEDHRYQLFVGVQAGNGLLTYKSVRGKTVSKIVHVHEHELTYEANLYERAPNGKISLFEEGLLSREMSPLIIGKEQVRKFASEHGSKKINDHVYKVNFDQSLLGHRRYLEITHLDEPVFVGLRDVSRVVVPSEDFMKFVLANFEEGKLGNRCIIQVNLAQKIERVEVSSESVAHGLMTKVQMLDNDGKFYNSVSEKTRKIIVVGEYQGAAKFARDAKVNIKINYLDGTTQFMNSYCSPNSYLVEQL